MGQLTAVALVSNCRSDVALVSTQTVALGSASSALLITKQFASKETGPPHELTLTCTMTPVAAGLILVPSKTLL